jgi:hypothetical protein
MRTLAGWLAGFLCRSLIPDEREAVLGDLDEHAATDCNIVYELLTLLLHRQSSHWRMRRPWLVLICVVAPTGLFLSEVGHTVSSVIVMQAWTRSHSGAWFQVLLSGRQMAVAVFCTSAGVIVSCWLSGDHTLQPHGQQFFHHRLVQHEVGPPWSKYSAPRTLSWVRGGGPGCGGDKGTMSSEFFKIDFTL